MTDVPITPPAAFIIHEGVLSIPAWEWDSTQPILYGIPVHVNVYPPPDWGASFVLPNGTIIGIRAMKWDPENYDRVDALVLSPIMPEAATYPMIDPTALLDLIRETSANAS